MRRKLLAKLFLTLISCACVLWGCMREPPRPSYEIQKNILAISSAKSTSYLLLQPKRAVLINSGSSPDASEIMQTLAKLGRDPQQVHGVFVTAAHPDLSAGAANFKNAITYIGVKDHRTLHADKHPKALLPKLQARLAPRPSVPHSIRGVQAGDRIQSQGFKIDVVATPGASRGSVMYLFDEILFTGNGLYLVDSKPSLPAAYEVASRSDLRKSLTRLVQANFHTIADGRGNTARLGPKDIATFIKSLD